MIGGIGSGVIISDDNPVAGDGNLRSGALCDFQVQGVGVDVGGEIVSLGLVYPTFSHGNYTRGRTLAGGRGNSLKRYFNILVFLGRQAVPYG